MECKSTIDDDDDDPVCASIELNLKPPTSRTSSGRSSAPNDDGGSNTHIAATISSVDETCAVLHESDAHKLDVWDGEPALLILRDGSESSAAGNSHGFVAAVCRVRVSQSSSKRKGGKDAIHGGEVLLWPAALYEYMSSSNSSGETDGDDPRATAAVRNAATPPAPASAASTTAQQYVSPSKSNFSFSKGGGGDSFISPSPTNKCTSPSGSKFSFSKGGGGDSFTSPSPRKIAFTMDKDKRRAQTKVVVTPLANLKPHHLRRLCTDAESLLICPANDSSKLNSTLSSSEKIIRALILSKYDGIYVQAQFNDVQGGSREKMIVKERISISFRGQTERFNVIRVTPMPSHDREQEGVEDQDNLSAIFSELDISSNSSGAMANTAAQKADIPLRPIACMITSKTKITLVSSHGDKCTTSQAKCDEEHNNRTEQRVLCAGLDSTLSRIKDALLPPLLHPDLFPSDGPLRPPKGALLYGPHGVGKSLLGAQIANDVQFAPSDKKVHVRQVQCADILSATAIVGEAEKMLTGIFEEADRKSFESRGSLVILDDIHLICHRRGRVGGSGDSRVDQLAGTLLALLDSIGGSRITQSENSETSGGIVVLAITTEPSLLDPALRRPGRLDVEVEVPVPDDEAREDIIKFHLAEIMLGQQIDEIDARGLARLAKGFTGADCKLAIKEAARTALLRSRQPKDHNEQLTVKRADLEHAIRITKPSAIKAVAVEVPKVPWSAIGGMDDVKALLKESIELPLLHPHLFELLQVPPPKGILLYGPPGCSKTLMARAIATEGSMNFLAVKGPELLSKWLGESERALASLFRRARLAAPAVIFFDEMDAIASKRGAGGGGGGDRLLSQLLTELDGVTSGGNSFGGSKSARVVVVGATNRPDVLDPALTRPGRMDRMIYVGLPDEEGRKSIFKIGLSGKDCHEDVDLPALSSDDISKGYSGAEIIALCRDAALHAIGEMDDSDIDRPQIRMRHLLHSIKTMKPRTTCEMLQFYESFRGRQ